MFSFLPLILIGLVTVLILRLRSTFVIPARWRASGPVCGECGYAFSGQPICPECGNQTAHVGVITPRLLMRFGPGPITAFFCLLVLALVAWGLLHLLGDSIERSLLPPHLRGNAAANAKLETYFNRVTFRSAAPVYFSGLQSERAGDEATSQIPGQPAFGITVYEEIVRFESFPSTPAIDGEVTFAIDDPVLPASSGSSPRTWPPPSNGAGFSPKYAYITIRPLTGRTTVHDGKGRVLGDYRSVDPDAVEQLLSTVAIERPDDFDALTLDATRLMFRRVADTVATTVATPQNASPWARDMHALMPGKLWIENNNFGGVGLPVPAKFVLPRPPLLAAAWRIALPLVLLACMLAAFSWVLRRRRALLAIPR